MNFGKLRHEVTLQSPPDPTDPAKANSFGQVLNTVDANWSTIGTYPAFVQALSGDEIVAALEKYGRLTHKVTMRWVGPILTTYRFLWNGNVLNIADVIDVDNLNVEYNIMCQQVTTP